MSKTISAAATVALAVLSGAALADDMVYAGFPVTVKGYDGSKTTSVSYGGQIARHALHDSLKKLAGSGDGKPNPDLKARMMAYFEGKDAGREIIAPATKGPFMVSPSTVGDLSKKGESGRQDVQGHRHRNAERHDRAGARPVLDRQGVVRRQGLRQGQRLRLSAADLQVRHGRGVLQPGRRRLSGRVPRGGQEAQRQALQGRSPLHREGALLGRGLRLLRDSGSYAGAHAEARLRHRQAQAGGCRRRRPRQGRQGGPEDRNGVSVRPIMPPGSTPRSTTRATEPPTCTPSPGPSSTAAGCSWT